RRRHVACFYLPRMLGRFRTMFVTNGRNAFQSLFEELSGMADFGRVFETASRYPAVNVHANQEHAVVTAELSGVDAAKLEITVQDDKLVVAGERTKSDESADARTPRKERPEGRFHRAIPLPFHVDATKVAARYENGLLVVELPRAEEDKPRRIEIRG